MEAVAPAVHAKPTPEPQTIDEAPGNENLKQPMACAVPVPVRLTHEPAKFQPSDDAARWIKLFERAAAHNAWQEDFKLQSAELCMTGVALQWAKTQSDRIKTWTEWRQAFLRRFDSGRIAKAKQQLRNLSRGQNDSLLDHLDRVQWLCHQVNPTMPDDEIVEHFGNTVSEEEFAHIANNNLTADLEGIRRILEKRQKQASTRNRASESVRPRVLAPTVAALRPQRSRSFECNERSRSFEQDRGNEKPRSGAATSIVLCESAAGATILPTPPKFRRRPQGVRRASDM
ncbi:uncharacterized protein LOC108864693 [Galendromus occidentalis]|uniref:Uncharacterized protein LOC108864693 n=1 Tax=Galendromus occidentalis TaxID=34638 RepID=A0AAJ7L6Y2_9ACAR|nr:uncharacterized protein LOC108864693 [Galendromus occidentalis]